MPIEPLQHGLLAGNNDVDAISAAQAMIGDRKQTVCIRRKVHAHYIGLLVDDVVDEAGILMAEPILAQEAADILRRCVELTTAQHNDFMNNHQSEFMRLAKELENTVGEKERAIGAFRQHTKEHGCEP